MLPAGSRALELELEGDLDGLVVVARTMSGTSFTLEHADGRLRISVPEDASTGIAYRSQPIRLTRLHVFFDAGVIEIFANDGAVCGTRRTYALTELHSVEVRAATGCKMAAHELLSSWRSDTGTAKRSGSIETADLVAH